MCVQNLKSVALPNPEIIVVPNKFGHWAVPGYSHAPSSQKFLMGFSSDASYECTCQIRSKYSFTCSSVNRGYPKIGGVPGYAHTRGGRRGSGMVPFERALVSFYRPSIVTFPLSLGLHVSDILSLLFSRTPLFPYRTSSLPKIYPHSPGSRRMVFGLPRAKVLH